MLAKDDTDALQWPDTWLSEGRFWTYRSHAEGDRDRAFQLYVWNGRVAAALLRDLGDLEVLVRNAFDVALGYWDGGSSHWILDPASPILRVRWRESPHPYMDLNSLSRERVADALRDAGGLGIATPGKLLASLSFGFWVNMTTKAREDDLWVPYISRAFISPHPPRKRVESRMRLMNELRNRVAHHEPLLKYNLAEAHSKLLELSGWIDPRVRKHIETVSAVAGLLDQRP